MGLDVYLQRQGNGDEANSTTDPEHMFKRGYFHSSYNGGGLNTVMHRCGCPTLYDIFQPPDGASRFTPDWQTALARAQVALEQYRDHVASPAGGHVVIFVACKDDQITSERDALRAYVERAQKPAPSEAYRNKVGHFWHNGAKLKAAIPGAMRLLGTGLFLVFEHKVPEGERDWYETALLIVVETIEYVLASGAPDEFSLFWSA